MRASVMTSYPARYPLIPIDFSPSWDYSDNVTMVGINMVIIHNVYIRALNSIHYNAPRIKKGDETAFAGYCMCWIADIHSHHESEEEIMFPFLQSKFDMAQNIEQHEAFLVKLKDFEQYITDVFNQKATYDGKKTQALVEQFGDVLVGHLHDEIPTISADRMRQYKKEDLQAMVDANEVHIRKLPLTTSVCLVLTHHDFKAIPTWPPMPGPLLWIIRNVLFWKNSSYWKFSPYTRYGEPQTYDA